MKRIGAVLLSLCLLCCGCSSTKSENIILESMVVDTGIDDTILTYFGYRADSLNLISIENILHSFMEQNEGFMVAYEGVKGTAYWEALEKRALSGNLDDVFMIDHERFLEFSQDDLLADLSDISTIDSYSDLCRSLVVQEDGSVYYLPTCISSMGMYVNLDLLNEYGLDVPDSWQDFRQACIVLKNAGYTPLVCNATNSLRTLAVAVCMRDIYEDGLGEEGIRELNENPELLTERLKQGLEAVNEIIENGWIDPQATMHTASTSEDLAEFAKGNTPFLLSGAWASSQFSQLNPDFDWEIYPYPVGDTALIVINPDSCVSVSAESEHLEDATTLLEYITQEDVMFEYAQAQSSFSATRTDLIPEDPKIQPLYEAYQAGAFVVGSDYRLNVSLDTILTSAIQILLEGGSLEEAFRQLEAS